MEIKKIKCEACGMTIDINELDEISTCPYCGSKYYIKEDNNINIETTYDYIKVKASIEEVNDVIKNYKRLGYKLEGRLENKDGIVEFNLKRDSNIKYKDKLIKYDKQYEDIRNSFIPKERIQKVSPNKYVTIPLLAIIVILLITIVVGLNNTISTGLLITNIVLLIIIGTIFLIYVYKHYMESNKLTDINVKLEEELDDLFKEVDKLFGREIEDEEE